MIRIRPYQPRDAQQVCDLLTKHTSYQRDAAFWLWSNRVWPESRSIVTVAEEEGVVVGHYAILPLTLNVGNRKLSAGIGVHAFIAPSHRKKVPIFQISKKCYAQAKEAGLQLIWGFPNANYCLIQEKVEGWQRVELFDAWVKPVAQKDASRLKIKSIDPDDSTQLLQLNDLLDACSLGDRAGWGASLAGWLDRYHHHPQNTYQFHIAQSGAEAVAALV
ncbi:GNAT family N-acetyltransferase, partial [bacterium]|nr:GNAT family N-acetyltransferase [bacterium]